jgi:hypothetical protein
VKSGVYFGVESEVAFGVIFGINFGVLKSFFLNSFQKYLLFHLQKEWARVFFFAPQIFETHIFLNILMMY